MNSPLLIKYFALIYVIVFHHHQLFKSGETKLNEPIECVNLHWFRFVPIPLADAAWLNTAAATVEGHTQCNTIHHRPVAPSSSR